MAPYRGRLRLTHTNSQYRLLAFSLIYTLATGLIFAVVLFLPVIIRLKSGSPSSVENELVADQFLAIHSRAWPAIFIVFVLLAIHSLIVSHRIAGPLYRFRCSLKAMADGNLSMPVIIRENDYLVTEAEAVNVMIASLRAKVEDIQEQYAEMHRVFSDLKRSIDSGSIQAISQDIERLGARMQQLKACVDQFRTASVATRVEGDLVAAPASGGSATINRS